MNTQNRETIEQEVAQLIDILHNTEKRLRELTGDQVDTVVDPSSQSNLRKAAQQQLRKNEEIQRRFYATQAATLDALPAHIALLDRDGVIVSVNSAWRAFARDNGLTDPAAAVGRNYLAVCDSASGIDSTGAREAAAGLRKVLDDGSDKFELEYTCNSPEEKRWFRLTATPLPPDTGGAVVMHIDITERELALEAAARNARQLATVVEAQQNLARLELKPGPLMEHLAAVAQRVTGADGAVFETLERGALHYSAASGLAAGATGIQVSTDASLSGEALRLGRALCNDAASDARLDDAASERLGARSMALAAISGEQGPVGVIKIVGRHPGQFGDADLNILELLAETFAAVLRRHRDAEKLRDSEAQYRLLFQNNPLPMWIYDNERFRFLAVNEAAVKHYGYSQEEFLAMTIADIRPAEETARLDNVIDRHGEGGVNHSGIQRHRCKDGSLIEAEIVSHQLTFEGRGATLVLANDVTVRQRAERELAHLNRTQQMLSLANEALLRTGTEEELLADITRIAVDAGGYKVAWVGYAEWDERFSIVPMAHAGAVDVLKKVGQLHLSWSEELPEGRGATGRTIREGTPQIVEDITRDPLFPRIHSPRELDYQSMVTLPLRDSTGRAFGLMALYRPHAGDFIDEEVRLCQRLADNLAFGIQHLRSQEERRRLEIQLQQAQRLESLGQLTGGVAHDFNNLLTVIEGNSELLLTSLANEARLGQLAEIIQIAARRGADLTHRLLAFAQRQPLEPHAVDINELLVGMEGLLRRTLSENIDIELVKEDNLWQAMVDHAQLEGALLNLSLNARDAMAEGGWLTFETRNARIDRQYAEEHSMEPGPYVLIAVSDTGIGIPRKNLDRLFEPFFTTKAKGKGTGLGLSMVYGFVKQSRGHVKIYSEEGVGTTVKLYLPRAEDGDKRPQEKADKPSSALPQGSGTVLVVEDDEMVRNYVQTVLATAGYRVLTAEDGPTALEIIRNGTPVDLLFTDVVMPGGMSGQQLVERVQALRPDLPVLYTSGYTENAIVHHGRLDAGVHLLSKPYRQIDLLNKIREMMGHYQT